MLFRSGEKMILTFFVIMGFLALAFVVYGFVQHNAFAFALGAVRLIVFSALLLSGVEVENGIQKVADGQYETIYQTLIVDNDFTVQTLFYFSLSLGIFALGYLVMDMFTGI